MNKVTPYYISQEVIAKIYDKYLRFVFSKFDYNSSILNDEFLESERKKLWESTTLMNSGFRFFIT